MKRYATLINEQGNIAVDDTLLVKGYEATAGSRMLEGFKPLFSAEAVTRLEAAGYTIAGKTHVGEFGLDLLGEFSYYAPQTEGALKGAAASLVAEGNVKAALAVDQNGAPRRAAALAGVCFLKPTYSTVSRYGVISCAASGETVGVYAKNTADVAEIMGVIAGHDEKDGTSHYDNSVLEYKTDVDMRGKMVGLDLGMLKDVDEETKARVMAFADALEAAGVKVMEFDSLAHNELAATAWQILSAAETCNNVSRYDGVKYGHRAESYKNIDELYVNSRTEGFNFLTKATVLYGSDVLSKTRYADCYDKSLRMRRTLKTANEQGTAMFEAVITPACSKASYEAYDIHDAFGKVFAETKYTAMANLIGHPALVCRGVQLTGQLFSESKLLSLAALVEKEGK